MNREVMGDPSSMLLWGLPIISLVLIGAFALHRWQDGWFPQDGERNTLETGRSATFRLDLERSDQGETTAGISLSDSDWNTAAREIESLTRDGDSLEVDVERLWQRQPIPTTHAGDPSPVFDRTQESVP